ncbi:hypothetical protein N0B31_16230 [Salinirubellus salinus]|uniref:Uncharacterized protein n=1 Tax=Salinirubellus salinus TaxID=1364945 RepID=A0A9E7UA62_9EURY|nr:hypothetical protein [Salinirubellus salinus]UWM53672.1 hypothetical protein N0B31_16230 [Salinirubellus salinus]
MTDRVSSENASVETVRATLASAGATGRPRIAVPEETAEQFPADELVTLVLGGTVYHARVDVALDDSLEIRGAYDNRRLAREADGENRLVEWAKNEGVDVGRSVLLDTVVEGERYGVRKPGETTVYEVPETTVNTSLDRIAQSLDGGDDE